MTVVIQCAARKRPDAGYMRTGDGKPVVLAHPEIAPADPAHVFARPDEASGLGKSWREVLLEYNRGPRNNPLGLLPAYRLYENPTYERLVEGLGLGQVYILSAGWGLITADFLTPYYDITFSPSARGDGAYKRRRKADRYSDFYMLADDMATEIVFLGSKDYASLFCSLTSKAEGQRKVFYNSAEAPHLPGCVPIKFNTTTRTNWHYECANELLRSIGA